MSAIEKLLVQIFEKKKSIIDQAQRQCHLFDQHLASKLLIDGIVPPPWLTNPVLSSLTSDPKDLNKNDPIFEGLFSRPESTVPFSGRHCSLLGNLGAKTDDCPPLSGLHSECHPLKNDSTAGDGLSNLPDCSVNNVGHSSTSAPEMDSGSISPQIQMGSRISHCHKDPALSLAKLQRSKSRQKALELRHSAKAAKNCSGDDNKDGVCASRITGSAVNALQLDHIGGPDLVKAVDTNIQSSAAEVQRGDCLSQKNDQSNYSGRITRSKSLAKNLNSSNVVSSSVSKEDGPESNNAVEPLKPVDPPCFTNGSRGGKETDKRDYQRRETESNVNSKRLTRSRTTSQGNCDSELLKPDITLVRGQRSCGGKETDKRDYQSRETESIVNCNRLTRSRSTSQANCDSELLKPDTSLVRANEVGLCDSTQPTDVELTVVSKSYDHANESRRKINKDSGSWGDKLESSVHFEKVLTGSICQSSNDDVLVTGGSVKSICESAQSPQTYVSQRSQAPAVPVVVSFSSQKDPDSSAVEAREVKNIEGIAKPVNFSFCDKSSNCSKSAASSKSQNLQGSETAARSSSGRKDCNLDTEMATDSEKVAAAVACRNTRAVTTCTTEGPMRPLYSRNLDGRDSRHTDSIVNKSSLAKSLHIEPVVAEKPLNTQENIIWGVNVTDITDDGSDPTLAKVDADFDGLVEKHNGCLGSSPKIELDITVLRPPSDFVKSVKPKQLDFDDDKLCMNGNSNSDSKVGQNMPPEKVASLVCQDKCSFSPETYLLEKQEVMIREEEPQMKSCEGHSKEVDAATKIVNARSFNTELPIEAFSSMNHLIPSQVMGNGSLGNALQTVTDLAVGSPSTDKFNTALTQQVPSSGICLHQNNNLSDGKELSDGKDAFSNEIQILKYSRGSFTSNIENSCPQQKRRKIESQAERFLPAPPSLLEKPRESRNQRLVNGSLNIKEDNQEAALEVQHLTSHHRDISVNDSPTEVQSAERFLPAPPSLLEKPCESSNQRLVNGSLNIKEDNQEAALEIQHLTSHHGDIIVDYSPTEVQNAEGCGKTEGHNITEGSSLEVRSNKKFNSDGRDNFESCLTIQGSSNSHDCSTEQMVVSSSSGFTIGSTRRCIIDEKLDSWHSERSNSRRKTYLGGSAKLSDGSSVSQGIQSSDMIGTYDTMPEIEEFIIQPDEAPSCIGDKIELEKLNFPSDAIEYTSFLEHLGRSTFMNSPLCYSSTPYGLHKIPDLCKSLPNGLVEGMTGMGTSISLNDESGKLHSDCLPNRKDQSTWDIKKTYTSPVQTLWDRINSKFGSSGERESLKTELPCIDEENEAADEIANTFQKGIGPEVTNSSIRKKPLAEITNNADDILADGCAPDSVAREFNRTLNQVKQKLEKQDAGRRRFEGKRNESQSTSLGANRAKRTTESVCNRSSRPKLSGKNGMKRGPTYSGGEATYNNVVSNMASFIPLVQQKRAAEVITGKRDIKVKALEVAEAAKRLEEKKQNERKIKKEAMRLEREKLEQHKLSQLQLQNKKKEAERKKKEAEIATKKRQREEEERKEKEGKRKRVDEVKRKYQEHEEKAKKEEKEPKCCAAGEGKHDSKECIDRREKSKNLGNNREGNTKIPLAESLTIKDPTNEAKESFNYSAALNDCGNAGKINGNTIKGTEDDDLTVQNTIQEQSYDISPYKGSDDEDEDEDDSTNNNKFVPSWASKHLLFSSISSQKLIDLDITFPLQSFSNIAEVLLPRKLQIK